MPFELGIDVGCRAFRKGKWAGKRCLILGSEKYKYQAAISDISNSDIAVHNNEPKDVVTEITNWLDVAESLNAPGPTKIWGDFTDFMTANYEALTARGYSDSDIRKLPVGSLLKQMKKWVKDARKA